MPESMTAPVAQPPLPTAPSFLPPLPGGAVYLGMGSTFKRAHPEGYFDGWVADENSTSWASTPRPGGRVGSNHYAAPFDSEIVRLNRGLPPLEQRGRGVERVTAFRDTLAGNTPVRVEVDHAGKAVVAIAGREVFTARNARDLRGLAEVLEAAAGEMEVPTR